MVLGCCLTAAVFLSLTTLHYRLYMCVYMCIREGVKKIDFFKEKVLNYGWVGVNSPKLVKIRTF